MRNYINIKTLIWIFGLLIFQSCTEFEPVAPKDDEEFAGPIDGLNPAQLAQRQRGDRAFAEVFSADNGLGPIFVSTSCISCHAVDGKGHPFTTLIRFGQTDSSGNNYLDKGGPQIQNRALPGFSPELIPQGAVSTKLTPPINAGVGFLELVSDADIIAMSDPNDSNGDGISGVPNYNSIPGYITPFPNAIPQGDKYICRFGKKGSTYNLLQQTANAYNQDMGIASSFNPIDVYSLLEIDPEVSIQTVNDVLFYLQTLKVPIQRNMNDAVVQKGKQVFINAGCEGCHRQTLKTGYSPVEPLSNKEFHPYTDLLLHDMGQELDDGYTEGSAKTYEWRTPPLWGLGLAPNSQGGQYFLLHDGRAKSIEEAISLHGGEAAASRNLFNKLSISDREALIKFLKSL
ncbi:MAG: hypothetical protein HW421_2748 [Ignavibacteria bacterium]|nr:hypothetical protein [Ignavibacteria bacterium]